MITEFPARNGIRCLISCEGLILPAALPGSSRQRSVRTDSNVKLITDLVCSQEGQLGTSKSPREIARESWHFAFLGCKDREERLTASL